MRQQFKVGDKVMIRCTGEVKIVTDIVRAAYCCYYVDGSKGYFIGNDLRKIV